MRRDGILYAQKAPSISAILGISGDTSIAKRLNEQYGNGLGSVIGTDQDVYSQSRKAQETIIQNIMEIETTIVRDSAAIVSYEGKFRTINKSAQIQRGGLPLIMQPAIMSSPVVREYQEAGRIVGHKLPEPLVDDHDREMWQRLINNGKMSMMDHADTDGDVEVFCTHKMSDPYLTEDEHEMLVETTRWFEQTILGGEKDPTNGMQKQKKLLPEED